MTLPRSLLCERVTGRIHRDSPRRRDAEMAGRVGAPLPDMDGWHAVLCDNLARYTVGGTTKPRRSCSGCLSAMVDARTESGIPVVPVAVIPVPKPRTRSTR